MFPGYLSSELHRATSSLIDEFGVHGLSRHETVNRDDKVYFLSRGVIAIYFLPKNKTRSKEISSQHICLGLAGKDFMFKTDDLQYAYKAMCDGVELVCGTEDDWFGRFPIYGEAILSSNLQLHQQYIGWMNKIQSLPSNDKIVSAVRRLGMIRSKSGVQNHIEIDTKDIARFASLDENEVDLDRLFQDSGIPICGQHRVRV